MILALLTLLPLTTSAFAAPTETLWQEWYLISRKGQAMSYFKEVAEKRPGEKQVAVTQSWVEKMGPRSEVYIGSVASEDNLTPVAFFVERKGGKPYKTDGRIDQGKLLVTFKPGTPGQSKNKESTSIGANTYLSSLVPMVIARRVSAGKSGAFPFTAIVEDGGDMNVEIKKGEANPQGKTRKIGKNTCRLSLVQFNGESQEWWITSAGKVCLVEFPENGTKMELSSEAAVKKALGE